MTDDTNSTMEQTANSTPRPEASLWKHVREYLELPDKDKATTPAPIVTCPICLVSELSIEGLAPSSKDANLRRCVFLLCGHMTCKNCMDGWVESNRVRKIGPFKCPLCRHELLYSEDGCRHHIPIYSLPRHEHYSGEPEDEQYFLNHVPRTLPEGAKHPERCNKCRYRRVESMCYFIDHFRGGNVPSFRAALPDVTEEEVALFDGVDPNYARDDALFNLRAQIEEEYPSWGGEVLYNPEQ